MAFLHGVETVEYKEGPQPIIEVKSAVIGLVGTAPTGEPNKMFIVRSRDKATEIFGEPEEGYTLPYAFDAIFDHINTTVITINVFDPDKYLDVSEVTVSDVVNALHLFENALSEFGFFPKILIAPGWSHQIAVGTEMISVGNKIRAFSLIDAPEGLTPEEAVTFKNNFNSNRAAVCYPKVKIWDTALDAERLDWLSARMAGLMAKVDKEEGYYVSPSNHVLQGVIGLERVLSYRPNDEDSELNYVNSQGIVSVLNFLGSGYRLFGNRTTAFPFETHPVDSFICWRRTADIIEESIEYFALQFLDKPMFTNPENARTSLLIRVEESVNDFLRALMGRGALVYGKCYLRPEDNPTSELANGHLTYTYEITPPVPGERFTFRAVANVSALSEVFNKLIGG